MTPPSTLAERLRGVLRPPSSGLLAPRTAPPARSACGLHAHLEQTLGGHWREQDGVRAFVVERSIEREAAYGRTPIGDLAATLTRAAERASILNGGAVVRPPFLFFDLETTGLSGGAGTHAFLIGCGWFDETGAFFTRQYLLPSFAEEPSMLRAAARDLTGPGALVSFNGKSFDAPVLETRFLFHRLEWNGRSLPHLDVLHPARRFWRSDPPAGDQSSCSLTTLERTVLGAQRVGDVAGFEIPARYFQFVRSGDAGPLTAVLEHNRRDLLTLAGLMARLLQLIDLGSEATEEAQEALALGRLYEHSGCAGLASAAFERAIVLSQRLPRMKGVSIALEAHRNLAVAARRGRRWEEAATRWRSVLDTPGCPPAVAREALEALAIHHEHRVRDLQTAKAFALKSLGQVARPGWSAAVKHRLARLERKMTGAMSARLELTD